MLSGESLKLSEEDMRVETGVVLEVTKWALDRLCG